MNYKISKTATMANGSPVQPADGILLYFIVCHLSPREGLLPLGGGGSLKAEY